MTPLWGILSDLDLMRALREGADDRPAGELAGSEAPGSVAHELLHLARRPVTVVPARSLRTTTEDDGGLVRMEAESAARTVAP